MFKFSNLAKVILCAGLAAAPGMVLAGVSTATGIATLTVINDCTVVGSTVNLGTFSTAQTWSDVAGELGSLDFGALIPGSLGQEYVNWGSVTCDAGTPYTISIKGTGLDPAAPDALNLVSTGTAAGGGAIAASYLLPFVTKIGGVPVANDGMFAGAGAYAPHPTPGIGSGTPQPILGSVAHGNLASGPGLADRLVAGNFTDRLTYTLNF